MNWLRISGVFLRYFYVACKGMMQLSDLFYWPLVDILIWGLTSAWIQSHAQTPGLPLVLLTALIFWQIVWRGSIDISICLLQEFWHRNLLNLFSTPLKFSEWIIGALLFSISKLLVTIAFGSLVVYLLFALNVFSVGWMFLPFALALVLFGWMISFISSGLIVYFGHKAEMLAFMLGFLFAPFSAVFYPVEALPHFAQAIAWCLPTTYIFQGMRSILATGVFPTHYFWISMTLNLLYLAASLAFFKFMFEKTRNKGLGSLD